MKLSEAILEGSKQHPQGSGEYIEDIEQPDGITTITHTCALGAAAVGRYGLEACKEWISTNALRYAWPELEEYRHHPVSGDFMVTDEIIVDLNDILGWTREDIAAWLKKEEC